MTTTVVALVTINQEEPLALAQYLDATGPLLQSVGARIRQRFQIEEAVVGKKLAQTMIIVDYPSVEAVHQVFRSDIYRAVIPIRDKAFLTYNVCLLGNDGPGQPTKLPSRDTQ